MIQPMNKLSSPALLLSMALSAAPALVGSGFENRIRTVLNCYKAEQRYHPDTSYS